MILTLADRNFHRSKDYSLHINEIKAMAEKDIGVVEIRGKGRGIISNIFINKGTVIETAPVVPFEGKLPEELSGLPFAWFGKEAIALGIVQLINHDAEPNCTIECNEKERTISLITIQDIQPGEELSFDYDCELWFDPA